MDKILLFAIYLVNNYVSCETFLFAILHYRKIVCCLPAYPTRKASGTGHLLVCLPHFGLRPVRLDRLRICPFQSRQRQQNISLVCVHKAGLSFAKTLNWDGLSRQILFFMKSRRKKAGTNDFAPASLSSSYECFLLGKHTVERVCSGLSPLRRDRLWC